MLLRNSPHAYGLVARVLHWSSVALVATLYIGISGLDVPPKNAERALHVAFHASVGTGLLALMLARLAWRLTNPNPAAAYPLSRWHRTAVLTAHRSLYVLVFAACALGLLAHLAGGAAVMLPGGLALAGAAPPDPALARLAIALHDGATRALLLLVALHASAAVVNLILAGSAPQDGTPAA